MTLLKKLVLLFSLESWNTLLDAATKRNHCSVLTIANHTADGEIPNLKYHKTCRSRFTLKRDLNNLQQNDDVAASQKVRRTSRDEVSHEIVLPKKCIFCDKMDKYLRARINHKNVDREK